MTTTLDLTVDKAKRPTLAQFAETGISYRRLDYWTHCGYLRADDASPGSGSHRTWDPIEVVVASLMVRLTTAGLAANAAAKVARAAVEADNRRVELTTGVWIEVAA